MCRNSESLSLLYGILILQLCDSIKRGFSLAQNFLIGPATLTTKLKETRERKKNLILFVSVVFFELRVLKRDALRAKIDGKSRSHVN